MRKLFFILFLLISIPLSATKYYVATTGTDGAYPTRGTIVNPWLTWAYAFANTTAGDTCYFRGGTYWATSIFSAAINDGTFSHPTCFFNYPTEKPILDFKNVVSIGFNPGITLNNKSHVYLKELEVCNVTQDHIGDVCYGWYLAYGNDIRFNQCISHNIGGYGNSAALVDTVYYINCDAYNCVDTLSNYDPGGGGMGFVSNTTGYPDSYISYFGCRAWNCSDLGFGCLSSGTVVWDSCWSIHNGYYTEVINAANGSGWKWGWSYLPKNQLVIVIKNCVAAFNQVVGITSNDGGYPQRQAHIYNNFCYSNGYVIPGYPSTIKWGFWNGNTTDNVYTWNRWYRNNLSYDNYGGAGVGDYNIDNSIYMNEEYNYWKNNASVTDADFVSLDSTGMCGARQADGSLPITTFGHLIAGSNLIDAGTTNTGLPYNGSAPDIGAFEFLAPPVTVRGLIRHPNGKLMRLGTKLIIQE